MRSTELLSSILLFSAATSAWSAGWGAVGELAVAVAPMERRQGSSSQFDLSYTGEQGNTATTVSSATDTASNSDSAQSTNTADQSSDASSSGTGGTTGSARRTGSSTGTAKTTGKSTSSKTYDARLPAGGISMITPNALSTQYYKIEDYVTFVWNYTSLSATPSAIDVLASCSINNQLYTISTNVSVEQTQSIVWDTGAFQSSATVPLLTETYTLIVYDAAKDISSTPQAGYLGVADSFTFGMYTPQPYTPLSEFQCVTCNSAMTLVEKQTLLALVGMASLTAISFGWFTSVAGLW